LYLFLSQNGNDGQKKVSQIALKDIGRRKS
jgi:hypothetical protein